MFEAAGRLYVAISEGPMMAEAFESVYRVLGRDFSNAGKVSTSIKDTLKRLGVNPTVVRRVAIVSYEAEMNLVMYSVARNNVAQRQPRSSHAERR